MDDGAPAAAVVRSGGEGEGAGDDWKGSRLPHISGSVDFVGDCRAQSAHSTWLEGLTRKQLTAGKR